MSNDVAGWEVKYQRTEKEAAREQIHHSTIYTIELSKPNLPGALLWLLQTHSPLEFPLD